MNKVRTKECWDGTIIVTHNLVNGEWAPTHIDCPPKPPEEVKPLGDEQ